MKWIKCLERLPEIGSIILVEYFSGDYERKKFIGPADWWQRNVNAWLDESERSFTIEDMQDAWNNCCELWEQRSGRCIPNNLFSEYMNDKYNIIIIK